MANTYFQFKQFLINQEKSGMKVTTDSCLFGAWIASQITSIEHSKILDIGTGTGLLSLMLAQVTIDTQIDAIDINQNAFLEANENFVQSIWSNRLSCIHISLQDYQASIKYDIIVCNPPFFKDNYKGQKSDKNQAIHSDHLSVEELIDGIKRNLKATGKAYILYPEREMTQFIIQSENHNLFLNKLVTVKNRKGDSIFRMIGQFSFQEVGVTKDEIIIRNDDRSYTKEFSRLLKEYYL